MKFKSILLLVTIFLPFCLFGQIVSKWEKEFGPTTGSSGSDNRGISISTDASGNCYATGSFAGKLDFTSSVSLTSSGNLNIFLAKYDKSGVFQWARGAGGTADDIGYRICTDTNGNSYITGATSNPATFGTITTSGGYGFIAKYDANGNCKWAKAIGGSLSNTTGYGICFDNIGNIYITGEFNFTANFGAISITSAGSYDMFVAKYDTAGNCIWAKSAGGVGSDFGKAICFNSGSLYITGGFSNSMTLGTSTIASNGLKDVFIAKYDLSGNPVWVKSGGSSANDQANSIACYNSKCSIGGYFANNAIFDAVTYPTSGTSDEFGIQFDTSGNWMTVNHSNTGFEGTDMAYDAIGNLYSAGHQFAPLKSIGNPYSEGICVDKDNNIFSTGHFFNGVTAWFIFVMKSGKSTFINQTSYSKYMLYPNPASDILIIQFKENVKGTVFIRDLYGKRIIEQSIDNRGHIDLDVKTIVPGFYEAGVVSDGTEELIGEIQIIH